MSISHDLNKLPKVGAIVSAIKIYNGGVMGDMADIEFIDSDCKADVNGYVKPEDRKHVSAHLYIERSLLEKEVLNNYVYPKSGIWQQSTTHTEAEKIAEVYQKQEKEGPVIKLSNVRKKTAKKSRR